MKKYILILCLLITGFNYGQWLGGGGGLSMTKVKKIAAPVIAPGIDVYTTLMLHLNGLDGGVVFADDEFTPKSSAYNGTVTTSITQKKFGNTSAYFAGSAGSNIETAASSNFAFGTNDFTIDLWVYWSVVSQNISLITNVGYNGSEGDWAFFTTSNASKYLQFTFWNASTANTISSTTTVSAGQWYQVVLVRSGTTFTLYLNGNSIGSMVTSDSMTPVNSTAIAIGGETGTFHGYEDEVRVSTGIARWNSNFTPPVSEYTR